MERQVKLSEDIFMKLHDLPADISGSELRVHQWNDLHNAVIQGALDQLLEGDDLAIGLANHQSSEADTLAIMAVNVAL